MQYSNVHRKRISCWQELKADFALEPHFGDLITVLSVGVAVQGAVAGEGSAAKVAKQFIVI
jgi:hypothetical protein